MNRATSILLVDDEPVFREFYGRLLRGDQYEVWTVANGMDALRYARERRPDLVLLDVSLPDLSGLEVCRRIKQDSDLADSFVALHSNEPVSSDHKVDGLDSGADDYIVRPITPNELLARIRTLVRLRNTAAALRASERYFRRLVEILPDAVVLADRQGHLRAMNPQTWKMLGYANEAALLECSLFDLVSAEDHDRLRADIPPMLGRQPRRNVEYSLRKKDGATLPAELSFTTASGSADEPAGLVVVMRDISDRRLAEIRRAAFSKLGELLSAASTSKEAAQIIVDIADQLVGWDSCHVRLLSAGQDGIVPILAYDEINGQRQECPMSGLVQELTPISRRVLGDGGLLLGADGSSREIPMLGAFGDTSRRSASRMYAPIRKGATNLGIVSIYSYRPNAYTPEDLQLLQALADHCTGALLRINIAESLQESEERFRSLYESAPFGLALHDAKGHFISTNRAYQEMLGYTAEELMRLGVKGITHPEDIAEGRRLFGELAASQRNVYRREKRYLRKDGRVVWAESTASVVHDAQGRLRFIVSMVDDITERKLAAAEIRRLNETLQQQAGDRVGGPEATNARFPNREGSRELNTESNGATSH